MQQNHAWWQFIVHESSNKYYGHLQLSSARAFVCLCTEVSWIENSDGDTPLIGNFCYLLLFRQWCSCINCSLDTKLHLGNLQPICIPQTLTAFNLRPRKKNVSHYRVWYNVVVGSKPLNRVVTTAQIRDGTTMERENILYYHPTTFSFTQHANTWDTLK